MNAAMVVGLMQFVPVLGVMVPIVALMIPIVAILSRHQRQMAEIIHGRNASALEAEVVALREEVRALRNQVHQQSLALAAHHPDQPPTAAVSD